MSGVVPILREVPVNRGSTGYYAADCKSIRGEETVLPEYKCGQILAGDMSEKEAQRILGVILEAQN